MGLYPNFKGIPDIFPPHILLHFHAVPRRFGVKMVYEKQSVLSSNHPVARQYALIFFSGNRRAALFSLRFHGRLKIGRILPSLGIPTTNSASAIYIILMISHFSLLKYEN